ncbi:copper resistance CopC/CopD family protein [Paenibacillus macquariensis]|uniref:Copper transport protein n=1 Tax=Paenibacillus macquariensis TaxID=948756 RepID=A0ABY1K9E4_9BACL|nr:copper resistance CopC/CopD family protein [Paenibacillus macquariensis]MEC0091610.1 copper resistance CopC/CopD family protein [Paenibacillus macquariensis]OAB26731.1 hypothetical protein PMSM_26595 [Paenibacillus macquariensis subsp. macquariensis]SIR45562.1 copper transport protein [Paenibacillus macquariensis]
MHIIKKTLGLGLILSLVCIFLFPSSIYAHAYLQQSTPSANETVLGSPSKITLQFNESIQPAFHSIQVTNSSGERVDLDDSHIADNQPKTLEGSVQPNLPDGLYIIGWKIISGDGHPLEGNIPFQIGNSSSSTNVPAATSTGYYPGLDLIVIRWLLYLSTAFLLGILTFYLFMYPSNPKAKHRLPQRSRMMLWISYGGIVASIVLSLPLQATIEARLQWSELWTTPWVEQMMQTSFSTIWLLQFVMVIVLGGVMYIANRTSERSYTRSFYQYTALLLGLGILLSKSFIGHAAASELKVLSITMNFLHLSASCIWIGSLLTLAAILPGEASLPSSPEDRKRMIFRVIRTFSYWGTGLVTILILSGTYASLKYIPTMYSLFNTTYGQVLLIKCGLVLIMLGLAAFNMLRGRRNKSIGRTVWIELSVGVITLVLAALLSNLPTAMSSPGPVDLSNTLATGEKISLQVSPNTIGNNQFEIQVQDASHKEVSNIQQIKLTLTSLDMDMNKYEILIPYQPGSTFIAEDLISMAGRWNIQVHILTDSLDTLDTEFNIRVGTE